MKILTPILISFFYILLSPTLLAEEEREQWYQIELLVFAYPIEGDATQELWQQSPSLKYPEQIVELLSPDSFENTATNSANSNQVLSADSETDALLNQHPFTTLSNDQHSFSSFLKQLKWQKDIRFLFHKAWRQPIASREQAVSILIRGGEQFDDHFELEGSVSIGLERYLHIKTDLWYSTFTSNVDQENLWPILPQLPNTANGMQEDETIPDRMIRGSSKSPNQLDSLFESSAQDSFIVENTMVLQQDRRMRSGELHYIDHPLMGVLAKIAPYEFPVEEVEVIEKPLEETIESSLETNSSTSNTE